MPDLCTGLSYIEALDFRISLIHVLEFGIFSSDLSTGISNMALYS